MSLPQLREDGEQLARSLGALRDEPPLVLAIPRGGVIIAEALARALGAPLDVLLAGKVLGDGGVAIGAVAEGGAWVVDDDAVAGLGLDDAAVEARLDGERRHQDELLPRMRGAWPLPAVAGRTVILVDDAIVTGLTMRAAIAAVRARRARRIVVATPLCAAEAAATLAAEVDRVVHLASAPAPIAARMHDEREREPCPPIGDAEIHELIARELRDVGADPFGALLVDGV